MTLFSHMAVNQLESIFVHVGQYKWKQPSQGVNKKFQLAHMNPKVKISLIALSVLLFIGFPIIMMFLTKNKEPEKVAVSQKTVEGGRPIKLKPLQKKKVSTSTSGVSSDQTVARDSVRATNAFDTSRVTNAFNTNRVTNDFNTSTSQVYYQSPRAPAPINHFQSYNYTSDIANATSSDNDPYVLRDYSSDGTVDVSNSDKDEIPEPEDPEVAARNARIAEKLAAYRASEAESQERTPFDPARIEQGYSYGTERDDILKENPRYGLQPLLFNLLFKGFHNRDKIPAKYIGKKAVYVVTTEEIEEHREIMKETALVDQATFVLQLSQEEMESILSAEDKESVLNELSKSIGTEDSRYKIYYVMAPEDCSPSSLEALTRDIGSDVDLVVPRKIGPEMKGAVVVDVSEKPEVAIRNLELALNYNNETAFRKQFFLNSWIEPNANARILQQGNLRGKMTNLFVRTSWSDISPIIDRKNILHDSFEKFKSGEFDNLGGQGLYIRFIDEDGIDAGGLKREWFEKMAQEIFRPSYGLFLSSETNQSVFYPNDQSFVNSEHLKLFEFVGMILAKALLEGISINAHLARFMYKHILGIKPELVDLKEIDESKYKSLCWILDNDAGVLGDSFMASYEDFGVHKEVELKVGGNDIILSEENKAEYVKLMVDFELMFKIEEQIKALLRGFYRVIPKEKIMEFEVFELDNLLAGRSEIDVDDWQRNTEYLGFSPYLAFFPTHPQIVRFWNVVRGFNQAQLRKLLQFATGSSGVPAEGFAGLRNGGSIKKFNIINNGDHRRSLPKAHTCFNQIELPQAYESEDQMREKLLLAIEEGADSFGFS